MQFLDRYERVCSMVEIGTAIKMIRQAKGLRLSVLAKRSGLSLPFLSLIEAGERDPSIDVLNRLAQALEIPVDALLVVIQQEHGTLITKDDWANSLAESLKELSDAVTELKKKLAQQGKLGETT